MSNYRSRKLLDAAKEAPRCFGCGHSNDGTVVAAHANSAEYGKAMGIKAHDWAIALLCHACHSELDQGKRMTREDKQEEWRRAHVRTLAWLFESGKVKVA